MPAASVILTHKEVVLTPSRGEKLYSFNAASADDGFELPEVVFFAAHFHAAFHLITSC